MDSVLNWIDSNQKHQIDLLAAAVAHPSVSAWLPTHRKFIDENIEFFVKRLEALDFKAERHAIGSVKIDGKDEKLPDIVIAEFSAPDPAKKTLLVYGHLDVQPAHLSDGWISEPFTLETRDGKLFGRGSTDDKGPVLAWLNAVQAFRETKTDLPVNLKFILESMEESGSEGLEEYLLNMKKENHRFLDGVDFCVISDSYWLGDEKPCLGYGLRGMSQYLIEIQCGKADMHSGSCGSLINEAMTDLVWLLNQLIDVHGNIMIPGIYDQVAALTPEEKETYNAIQFDMKRRMEDIGCKNFIHQDEPSRVLQGIWRYPWLSIHGIEGAFSDKGFKTVIPAKVVGKFSIRTVPNMEIKETRRVVLEYLNKLWSLRTSSNTAKFTNSDSGEWYYVDPKNSNFTAAAAAIKHVYGVEPDLIREGGSIPITIVISRCTGKDVCLLPIGCSNDGAHSQNEKINVTNYIRGAKVMAVYLNELANMK